MVDCNWHGMIGLTGYMPEGNWPFSLPWKKDVVAPLYSEDSRRRPGWCKNKNCRWRI